MSATGDAEATDDAEATGTALDAFAPAIAADGFAVVGGVLDAATTAAAPGPDPRLHEIGFVSQTAARRPSRPARRSRPRDSANVRIR